MAFNIVYRGATIRVGSGVALIGRSPACKVVLDDDGVSRRHARIAEDDHGVRIEDLGSANGVTVNGATVVGAHALKDGDVVRIGSHQLRFAADATPQDQASSPRAGSRHGAIDALWDDDEEEAIIFHRGHPTRKRNRLALLSAAADMELSRGDIAAAADVVRTELHRILKRAQQGKLPQQTLTDSLRYALALTEGSSAEVPEGGDDWALFTLKLLTHTATPADGRARAVLLPRLRHQRYGDALMRYREALGQRLNSRDPDAQATAKAVARLLAP